MSATTMPAASPAELDHATIRSIVIGIMLAMFLAALDQTIVAAALPTIGRELGDLAHLPWVATSYLVASTAVLPLYGKFSDIHGRRLALLIGIGVFTFGSVVCALAWSMPVLILARAVQGLGGGGLISLSQTIIADVIAPKERGRYQAYIASVFATSSIAGPALGGILAEHLHWSLIFWINLPLGLLAFVMTDRVLRRLPRHERPHRLDLLGAVLMVAATILLLLALSWGGARHPWLSPEILGLLGASALAWIGFVVRLGMAAEPLLPLGVITNPIVRAATAAATFGMGIFIGLAVMVPIYLQAVIGLTVADSGLALIALMAGTITGATLSGRIMLHVRHYRRVPMVGLVAAALAVLLLAHDPAGWSLLVVLVALAAIGAGIGTLLPVATVSVQNAVAFHELGTATATINFFRSLGGAVIVAAFGAIILGEAGGGLEGASAGMAGLDPQVLTASFRWIFLVSAVGFLLSLASLCAMEERPLRGGTGRAAGTGGAPAADHAAGKGPDRPDVHRRESE